MDRPKIILDETHLYILISAIENGIVLSQKDTLYLVQGLKKLLSQRKLTMCKSTNFSYFTLGKQKTCLACPNYVTKWSCNNNQYCSHTCMYNFLLPSV